MQHSHSIALAEIRNITSDFLYLTRAVEAKDEGI